MRTPGKQSCPSRRRNRSEALAAEGLVNLLLQAEAWKTTGGDAVLWRDVLCAQIVLACLAVLALVALVGPKRRRVDRQSDRAAAESIGTGRAAGIGLGQ
jgi:hypothetical protein